jgi:anti-sigma B factor antagonist
MARLVLHIDEHPECRVLRLDGELDIETEADFIRTCYDLLEGGQTNIIVDTSRLSFCDCSGLGAMILTQRQAERRGGYLRLIGVHGPLARLLTLGELVDTFPPYADLRQACG